MSALNFHRQDFPLPQNILHHSDNLLSDGLFLTQFLLLIHEVGFLQPRYRRSRTQKKADV